MSSNFLIFQYPVWQCNVGIILLSEVVIRSCSAKKQFLEILQNSQENTCARVSFLIELHPISCEFFEIFQSNIFHRTPPVAASGFSYTIYNHPFSNSF